MKKLLINKESLICSLRALPVLFNATTALVSPLLEIVASFAVVGNFIEVSFSI